MANPTTNYGFVLPTASGLVTDLPADFDVALQGVDTQLKALNPSTTLGDIEYRSATANTNTRLGIGSTGQVLTVAGGVPTWATAGGGGFPAWTSYTPTVTSTSGSITSYTAIGYYSQSGKTVVYAGKATITTAGTAAGSMIFTLPITAATRAGIFWDGTAVEHTVTGFGGWATCGSAATTLLVRRYDFTTFFANGAEVSFTINYEVA